MIRQRTVLIFVHYLQRHSHPTPQSAPSQQQQQQQQHRQSDIDYLQQLESTHELFSDAESAKRLDRLKDRQYWDRTVTAHDTGK